MKELGYPTIVRLKKIYDAKKKGLKNNNANSRKTPRWSTPSKKARA